MIINNALQYHDIPVIHSCVLRLRWISSNALTTVDLGLFVDLGSLQSL